MKSTTTKKQNLKALRKRRATRRFAFLKQLRRDKSLSASAKMVVWSLADDFYNLDTERCDPGFTEIARKVGRPRSCVIESIAKAKTQGWITFASTHGGSEDCTNRYTLIWSKKAATTSQHEAPSQPAAAVAQRVAEYDAANPGMSTREVAAALGVSQTSVVKARKSGEHSVKSGEHSDKNEGEHSAGPVFTENAEIIEEDEDEGPGSPNGVNTEGVRRTDERGPAHRTRTLSEPQRGEEEDEAALAARGFAAPLASEEEMAFQQLCQIWQVRDEFHDDI